MKMNGINGVNGTSAFTGQNMAQGTDEVTKRLQKQIANAQKALQELSANKDMGMEEKMQKRQELQQQINDLNNQLRQHQIDLRRERQQAQKGSEDEMAQKQQKKEDMPGYGMSKAGMEAMVSADTAIKQAKVYGRVGTQLKGEAKVLAGEIKLDKDRGVDVAQKEEKLAKLEERIQSAKDSQIGTLEDANSKLQKVSEKEQEEKLKDDGKKEEDILIEKKQEEKQEDGTEKDGRYVDIRL